MIKRILLLFALLLAMAKGYAQQAAYTLPSPKGWTVEKLPIPIDFAPKIPLKGVEELRFTPGWGDSKTGEYWSYAFLWFVEGTVNLKKDTLQSYLTQYFEGLYISNQKKDVDVPGRFTRVKIKKTHTLPMMSKPSRAILLRLIF